MRSVRWLHLWALILLNRMNRYLHLHHLKKKQRIRPTRPSRRNLIFPCWSGQNNSNKQMWRVDNSVQLYFSYMTRWTDNNTYYTAASRNLSCNCLSFRWLPLNSIYVGIENWENVVITFWSWFYFQITTIREWTLVTPEALPVKTRFQASSSSSNRSKINHLCV